MNHTVNNMMELVDDDHNNNILKIDSNVLNPSIWTSLVGFCLRPFENAHLAIIVMFFLPFFLYLLIFCSFDKKKTTQLTSEPRLGTKKKVVAENLRRILAIIRVFNILLHHVVDFRLIHADDLPQRESTARWQRIPEPNSLQSDVGRWWISTAPRPRSRNRIASKSLIMKPTTPPDLTDICSPQLHAQFLIASVFRELIICFSAPGFKCATVAVLAT